MKNLYLLPSAVALVFGLTAGHGAEIRQYKTTGYSPAKFVVHDTMAQSKKLAMSPSTKAVVIDRTHIAELAAIKDWPDNFKEDQGNFGTCTANSAKFSVCYLSIANSKNPKLLENNPEALELSRWFLYYNTRFLEAKLNGQNFDATNDSGASIIGSILALDIWGCCPEDAHTQEGSIRTKDLSGSITYNGWPYTPTLLSVQPTPFDYLVGLEENRHGLNPGTPCATSNKLTNPYARISKAIQYRDLTTPYRKFNPSTANSQKEKDAFINAVIIALKANHPVMAGVMLDDSFMESVGGHIPTPNLSTFRWTGGHAIPIVGYGPYNKDKPNTCYFKFLNSWSPTWGDHGFGYFEESYFSNVNIFQIEAFETWLDPNIK